MPFDQRDELKFLTKDEAATAEAYQKAQAQVDALRNAFASGDPGEQASVMGLSPSQAAQLGPSGVNQLAQAFMQDQLVGKGNLAGKMLDITQQASNRKDAKLSLDALSPTPIVKEALAKAQSMGKNQAEQEASFLRMKSDLASAVLTNDPHVIMPKALAFLQAAKALDVARNSEKLGTPTDPKIAEMRDQLGLGDDKVLAGGIGPHEQLAQNLLFGGQNGHGMLPAFVDPTDLKAPGQEQGMVSAGDKTLRLGPNNSITSTPGASALPDQGGPLMGGAHVNKDAPLSFSNANPGGQITQAPAPQAPQALDQGTPPAPSPDMTASATPAFNAPLASGPDLTAKGLGAVGSGIKGAASYLSEAAQQYPVGRAIAQAPQAVAGAFDKLGGAVRDITSNPTVQSFAQGINLADQQLRGGPQLAPMAAPPAPSADPRAFGMAYKAAHPTATGAEIRQAFYAAFPEMLKTIGNAIGPSEAEAAEIPGDQPPDQATIQARMAKMGDLGGTPAPAAPPAPAQTGPDPTRVARIQQMIQQLQSQISLFDPEGSRAKMQQIEALKAQLAQ